MSDADILQRLFADLDPDRQRTLIEFAEFLVSRSALAPVEIGDPLDIPRPESESVVGALKRLKDTYPMIEGMSVFSAASSLMTEHMVQGRDVVEVIDEMEVLFEQAWQELKQGN